jgi:hypothetical protein
MFGLFLSAGIGVGSDFSYLSIALPNKSFAGKPFNIKHANLNSLEKTVAVMREAEQTYSLQSRILLESTGIYHYPLMHYLKGKGFCVSVINPIITKGSANINRLTGTLKTAFPQYIGIFSKVTVETSLVLLEKYASPQAFLKARKSSVIRLTKSTARFGQAYAETQYNKIISAAKDALVFGYAVPSNTMKSANPSLKKLRSARSVTKSAILFSRYSAATSRFLSFPMMNTSKIITAKILNSHNLVNNGVVKFSCPNTKEKFTGLLLATHQKYN